MSKIPFATREALQAVPSSMAYVSDKKVNLNAPG